MVLPKKGCRASKLAKIAGDMYRSLSESEKEVYKADYKGELETYKDEVKKWEESQTKEDKDLAKKMRAKKKKQKLRRQTKKECRAYEKPKKALNAYYLFMLEYRPQAMEDIAADTEPKKKYCVVTALLAAKWKILPDSEKQVFKDMAATQKLEREIALSDWEKQMIELKNYHLLRKSTLKEKKLVITPDNATSKESKRSKAEKKSGS